MRKLIFAALLIAAIHTVIEAAPVGGASPGPVIASVIAIDGSLSMASAGTDTWHSARVDTNGYTNDRFKTDKNSMAALEFTVGGRIGLSKGTEVALIGPRDAKNTATGTVLSLARGSVWAKMAPQTQPFQIKTPSCTIGIRGTEFVVNEGQQQTVVSVLDGEVGVTDNKTHQTTVGRPGNMLALRPGHRPTLRHFKPEVLRGMYQKSMPAFHRFIRQVHQMRGGTDYKRHAPTQGTERNRQNPQRKGAHEPVKRPPTNSGKRLTPTNTGKRLTPTHTDKRPAPTSTGRRLTPANTGRRPAPAYSSKRLTPSHGRNVSPSRRPPVRRPPPPRRKPSPRPEERRP